MARIYTLNVLTQTFRWGECMVFNHFTVLSELLHYMRCALTVHLSPNNLHSLTDWMSGPHILA